MIDILKGHGPALQWLDSVSEEEVVLPGFVVMEPIQGCQNQKECDLLLRETEEYRIEWPAPETSQQALKVFSELHLSHGTGLIDVLIGQRAVDLSVPLYTFNEKHYAPIPDLEIEAPYFRS
jgi:hypothetical protein